MFRQGRLRGRLRVAGAVPLALVATMGYAAVPAAAGGSPAAVVSPAAPHPMPSCQEWQTITLVPQTPAKPGSSASPTAWKPWCHNAPPTPFGHAAWDPPTVVGGPQLGQSGVIVDAEPGVGALPEVGDVSYVLADLDTGDILAAKSPHAWLRPASTLKTLTALTLIPRLDPEQVVVATDDQVAANGTRVGMVAGNPYPVHSLFEALLMLSANDAAYGLADAAGGYDETLALMNAKAKEIGAFDTVAVDPSGLDEPGQRSSAYDLALIGRAAMALPDFRKYIVTRDAVFPGGTDKRTKQKYEPFHIPNINDLLANYPGAIGIKPGRTNRAQHTFIGAATRDGRSLIVTQMGSTSGSWKPTAALLDWGFANADRVAPVGRLVEPGDAAPPRPLAEVPASLAAGAEGSGAKGPASGTPRPGDQTSADAEVGRSFPVPGGGVVKGALVLVTLLVGAGAYLVRRRHDN
ncbi:D-alanyl-D-alanine carboxypeptidase family protein [Intrasporangium chromatireducens]|nr:D-alanyl-D-alanine carboxypeptidase [Intrasporangium chromatireducens]